MKKNLQEQLAEASEKVREAMESKSSNEVEIPQDPNDLLEEDEQTADDGETIVEASESTSEPSKDVKQDDVDDEADDKGVSYKNRYHETVRKQKRLEEEMETIKQQLSSLTTKSEEQSVTSLRGNVDGYDAFQSTAQPSRIRDEGQDEDAPITKTEAMQIAKTLAAKERNDIETLKRFPDLRNENSVMFKETLRRISLKKQMGVNAEDPLLLIETASAVFGDLVLSGQVIPKKNTSDEEAARRSESKNTVIVGTRRSAPKPTSTKLTKMQQYTLNKFNEIGVKMSPEEYLKKANRS